MNNRASQAFTWRELLVVIAIIGILASLLPPILSRAKEKGYRTQCVNNFKQLGLAIQMYADDHGNQLELIVRARNLGHRVIDAGATEIHLQMLGRTASVTVRLNGDHQPHRDQL